MPVRGNHIKEWLLFEFFGAFGIIQSILKREQILRKPKRKQWCFVLSGEYIEQVEDKFRHRKSGSFYKIEQKYNRRIYAIDGDVWQVLLEYGALR